jgi:hypothetical protein
MTQAMISAPPKRSLTPAQRRLRKADPTMATRMDEFAVEMDQTLDRFQAALDREYDLAAAVDPPPPILDSEVALATEGWRLVDTVAVLYATVDDLQTTADAARFALARLALETLPAYTTYQQPALPPPPDSFDDGDPTENFHRMRADGPNMDTLIREASETPDDADRPGWWPALATKVERWWPRLRGWGRQLRAATTLLLAGVG